ncbi:MAG: peptidoglycan-binding protein [Oscillospiraceae bacterium]|jgi:Putative peptidoglycan-binding domain-containing protein|nr:peptidoglycan-binding protein [Oscillospiraceae bacterium]
MDPNDDVRFLGRSVTSLQTMLRVIALQDPTCPLVIPDGRYGAETARAVTVQQKRAGLPQTGITDFATWQAICAAYQAAAVEVEPAAPLDVVMDPNEVILEGSDNLHVLLIQAMLHTLFEVYENLDCCPLTGVCDEETVSAIRRLQHCCGMPESGILDKRLWLHLAGLYHQAVGNGDRKTHCGGR